VVPLIGYVDRFSARPGETVAVKVSSELGDPYRADFVRIIHGDANPGGPGLKFEEVRPLLREPTDRGPSLCI
jgi:N,N-dimethylformamidase